MNSHLPTDWTVARLGELATAIQYGYTEKAQQEEVGPRFLRITDIQDDAVDWSRVPFCAIDDEDKEKYLLRQSDLVFARTGATVGKSFLIAGSIPEAVFASYLIRVRLRPDIEPKYVSYFFRTSDYWRQISESQAGIGQPNVNGKKLAQIQIPVAPLDQQKRIVAEIEKQFSRLEEAVANLKRVKANLKRYKASVLKTAVEGKLTGEWRKAKVGELFHVVGGGTPTTSNTEFWNGGYPWITSADINDQYNIIPRRWITKDAINSSATNLVPKGSIIVVTRVGLGKVAQAKEDLCFSQDCQGLIFDEAIINSRFAMLQLSRKVQLFKHISRGTTINGVTKKQLLELEFLLPPVEDQLKVAEQIDRQLSVTDEYEAQVDANLQRGDRLRQSILGKAFRGELVGNESSINNAKIIA